MQNKIVLIFCCTFHEILLLLIVNGGAINFDALHQLLYLYSAEVSAFIFIGFRLTHIGEYIRDDIDH